jgi:CDGSH-type Zn-finger protein
MATIVTVLANGPLMVKGEFGLTDAEGKPLPVKDGATYLCRCGSSANKPFCDGTHKKEGFEG